MYVNISQTNIYSCYWVFRDGKICFFLNMAFLITIDKWVESNHHCFSHNTNWLFKGFALAAITPNYSHHLESVRGSVFNPSDCKQDVWESYEWINMRLCGECGYEGRNMRPVIPVGLMWVWVHTEKAWSPNSRFTEKHVLLFCLSAGARRCKVWKNLDFLKRFSRQTQRKISLKLKWCFLSYFVVL